MMSIQTKKLIAIIPVMSYQKYFHPILISAAEDLFMSLLLVPQTLAFII